MKNVLLIGSELGKGGAERSISLLSQYLEKNYNVTLCILSGRDRIKYYKTCNDVIFIDPPAATGLLGKARAWQYRIDKVKKLKKEKAIDISISFLEGPDYVNVLTKGNEKVVLSIRGSKVHDKVISGTMGVIRKNILIPWLYKKADQIVCVTKALNTELQHHFRINAKSLTTIYNFYESEEILAAAVEPLTEEEAKIFRKPVIITSGRLHKAKEQDKLIRIFSQLGRKVDARLMILGDGELKQNLISLTESLGLSVCDWPLEGFKDADVYLMGFQPNAFKFYQHSQLFVLGSSWEGFPNVLAEALICNIPVITTDCYTGPREILNISGLPLTPVDVPSRTTIGTLLPLLTNPTAEVLQFWAEEINYWLQAAKPTKKEFAKLTNRFTLTAMLRQWQDVVEN
jgi:glycosyltransferase involved in cell wall biosynthesis